MLQEVLIVDDDPLVRQLIEHHMKAAGFTVRLAENGEEGLRIVKQFAPRIVLADWMMPKMSGVELCRAIRADKSIPFTYIIIITARSDKEGKDCLVEALEAGADDYISKPFHVKELLARVQAGDRILHLEQELEQRCRLESESNHLRDSVTSMEHVLGVVGHELRTPLAGLRAISEFLLSDGARQTDKFDLFLRNLHQEIIRMSGTVNSLLEAARLNSGVATWNWSQFAVKEVCEESIVSVRTIAEAKSVQLIVSAQPPDLVMRGDADAIGRLTLNLVSNAEKHTAYGQIRVALRELNHDECRCVEIEVTDTGCGIPMNVVSRLGEAFALNAGVVGDKHGEGTGLGLSITKGIVAAHGGSISIRSEEGAGTCVTVRLRADLETAANAPVKIDFLKAAA